MLIALSLRFQDKSHGGGEALPLLDFVAKRLASLFGKAVVTRAAIVLGGLPVALDPAAMLESLEGWVERALIDLEAALGDLLDAESDSPPVHGLQGERFQDEEVDAPSEGVRFLRVFRCGHRASSLEVEKSIGTISLEVKRS